MRGVSFTTTVSGTRVYPSFAKEGWTRPKENAAKHPLRSGRGGCLSPPLMNPNGFDNRWLETTTPSAPLRNEAIFLDGAATPPSRRRGMRAPSGLLDLDSSAFAKEGNTS